MTTRLPFLLESDSDAIERAVEREVTRRLAARRKSGGVMTTIFALMLSVILGFYAFQWLPPLPAISILNKPTTIVGVLPTRVSDRASAPQEQSSVSAAPTSFVPVAPPIAEQVAPIVVEQPIPPMATAEIVTVQQPLAVTVVAYPEVYANADGTLYTPAPLNPTLEPLPPPPTPIAAGDYRLVWVADGPGLVKQCIVVDNKRACSADGIKPGSIAFLASGLRTGVVAGEPHNTSDEVNP